MGKKHTLISWGSHHNVARSNKTAVKRYGCGFVSRTISGPCSHRELVEQIASSAAVPVESLAGQLSATVLPRGAACFGSLYKYLDRVASAHAKMQWWISEKGINMAVVEPNSSSVIGFDEVAGRLAADQGQNGLSKDAVLEIAVNLDELRFTLKELQPAQRMAIARHNQQHTHAAIKTFSAMARNPRFSYLFRRRLYVARTRLSQSHSSLISD